MANNTLAVNVAQAISDFDSIKSAIVNADVSIPANTPTSSYGSKITAVRDMWEKLITDDYSSYSYLFYNMPIVNAPKLHHTEDVEDFDHMFGNCRYLESVQPFDTSNGKGFQYMFNNCTSLQSIPSIDISSGENFSSMFYNCTSLVSVPRLDTSNGTNFSNMFGECTSLVSVGGINFTNAQGIGNPFYNCTLLQNLTIEGTISASGMSVTTNTRLTVNSLLSILNALEDNAGTGSSPRIVLGSINKSKLTDAQLAIAANKGWTVL